ncbi:T9SS type A sorting domain-containing protein [Prolixibacteraceae bacterium Z1-6]|uniref:T9SS type A sorting domain-containing protein n=1 Tax=Draconibacterium aestuarii TaxID=2998507 RepID=A0A9X3F8R3_9BACT|nr:T9SS type A sorting domain-containing protein [Prolixibacteraceae bacterium Z1-6]
MKYKILPFLLISLFVCNVAKAQTWQMKQAPLMTKFAGDVDPDNTLPEYPRPQMERTEWMNLNGVWQFQPGTGQQEQLPNGTLSGSILVPFPVESAISGVKEHYSRLWYRRNFVVPANWDNKRILLHFGAVDYETEVYVNGVSIGKHFGGYDSFSFDITDYLTPDGTQELTVRVFDPTDESGFPRGKQTLNPEGIMYTSSTGIWQTVWMEPVAETHIQSIKLTPDIDEAVLKITVSTSSENNGIVSAKVKDGDKLVATVVGAANEEFSIPVSNQKLWSPSNPFLYDLEITLLQNNEKLDSAGSYFGMRKISTNKENGIQKLYLNNEFLFQMGPLDQGFWPDGLYTAPTEEALKFDIEMIKAFGFNMVRKHIKVEPQRWYYWADKLGLMVWQDMPSINSYTSNPQPIEQAAFKNELTQMVENHWNSPSIVMWVVFNEFQGQHNTEELVNMVKQLDPSRWVNQGSGGDWKGAGHVLDLHNYPAPVCPESSSQAIVCGEYGGIGLAVDDHKWSNDYFGYVTVPDPEKLLADYEKYIDQLTLYKTNQGLSAAVYTEITDVEIELNGLMTYDRLAKADVTRLYNANRKVIEQDIYMSHLLPNAKVEWKNWRYTIDTPPQDWYLENFDDYAWKTGLAGFGTMGTPGAVISTIWNSSDIWMRQNFELGDISSLNKENIVLNIHHDEDCDVYINGEWAATLSGWTAGYITVPVTTAAFNALKSNSQNTIAIHCKQTAGGQYIDAGISILSDNKIATSVNTIKENIKPPNFLYPNPGNNTIHFSKPLSTPASVAVFSASGQFVKIENNVNDQVDISSLNSGMYYLKVIEKGGVQSFKFFKI